MGVEEGHQDLRLGHGVVVTGGHDLRGDVPKPLVAVPVGSLAGGGQGVELFVAGGAVVTGVGDRG
ncbi:hypothetical protein [Corynebacterium neomassiliense]|uniref:hypothetical protein n=1 Tax=Corynebacterium neomassiliense TaxID=2079482 RepID=UPI0010324D71|nr:hypothetical protein [Corynebacterium neomassiliense]